MSIEFDEEKHPRDKDGKFTDKGKSSKNAIKSIGKALKFKIARQKYGYSKNQYNDYGWARGNEILNAGQNKDFRSKFASALNGYETFYITPSGEYIIPVNAGYGDNEGLNNTVVYCKGTMAKPIITRVVKIDVDNETKADLERRYLYDCEGRGVQPEDSDIFRFYNAVDYELEKQKKQ